MHRIPPALLFLAFFAQAQTNRSIEFLSSFQYPPYEMEEGGVPRGLTIETIDAAAALMGIHPVYRKVPWTRALRMMEEGSSDAVMGANRTPEREKFLDYTGVPVSHETVSLFEARGKALCYDGNLESLKPYRLAIVRGFSISEGFDRAMRGGLLTVEENNHAEMCLEKLIGGRIDGFVNDRLVTLTTLKKRGESYAVVERLPPIQIHPGYVAFSKKRRLGELAPAWDDAMRRLIKDGSLDRLVARYVR